MARSSASEDGFREIQLNGKQLVFLFMAATLVSAVIFLCGVFVGQGVGSETDGLPAAASVQSAALVGGESPIELSSPDVVPDAPPTPEELSYFERLERVDPPADAPSAADAEAEPEGEAKVATAPAPAPPADTPAAPPPAPEAAAATSAADLGEPEGSGYAVQVAALQGRDEAYVIAKSLFGKGYPAYVMPPPSGGSTPIYRVRVGKYRNRREADQVAARLEREEQFKPWISR